MLNQPLNSVLLFIVLLTLAAPAWTQQAPGQRPNNACLAIINSTPKQELDANEAAGLAYIREEEKLASDVYARLYAKWGLRIFNNICQSQERHFGVSKLLWDRYGLPDPAENNPIGVFRDESLQLLYEDLIMVGENSLNAALRVGATLEDLKIRDLEKAATTTDNVDLKFLYLNLLRASENHIRVFVRRLVAAGESYIVQYMSPAVLSEILASPIQPGMGYGAYGNGQRGRGRGRDNICPWIQP